MLFFKNNAIDDARIYSCWLPYLCIIQFAISVDNFKDASLIICEFYIVK